MIELIIQHRNHSVEQKHGLEAIVALEQRTGVDVSDMILDI